MTARPNKDLMREAVRFELAMVDAGLRQIDLANLVERDRRTVWRWCNGRTPVPAWAWKLIADRG